MLATPHALVGALLATKLQNPAIGLPVAFFSHYLFDLVPHWDWGWHPNEPMSRIQNPAKRKRIIMESVFDVMAGFVICYVLFYQAVNPYYLFAMIMAAQGPDWIAVPHWLFKWRPYLIRLNYDLQHHMQLHAALPWGIVNQAIAVALTGILIYLLPK